ncbi:MAG: 30S ribosomal protein S20 [Pseudomonadota bacterium]
MANHKSALKRAKQNENRQMRNKTIKTRVKNVVKEVRLGSADAGKDTSDTLNTAKSIIDKAAKKGAIHKRTAARKISRLSKLVNSKSA